MEKTVFWAVLAGMAVWTEAAGLPVAADGRWSGTRAERGLVAPLEWEHAGRIADADGSPVTGERTLAVRLYGTAEGGEVLWGRKAPVFLDANGNFSVRLVDALPALDGAPESFLAEALAAGPLWIECTLEGEGTAMQPRAAVAAAPYALFAGAAAGASGDFAVAGSLAVAGETHAGALSARDATAASAVEVTGNLSVGGDLSAAGGLEAEAFEGVGPVPVGTIILWYGDDARLPDGWAVCEELAGRFPVGAGGQYKAGDTGGKAGVVLAADEMPPHSHSVTYRSNDDMYKTGIDTDNGVWHGSADAWTGNAGGDSGGNTQAHENLPPYRALHYIQRVN
jgi:hypothetical protein